MDLMNRFTKALPDDSVPKLQITPVDMFTTHLKAIATIPTRHHIHNRLVRAHSAKAPCEQNARSDNKTPLFHRLSPRVESLAV